MDRFGIRRPLATWTLLGGLALSGEAMAQSRAAVFAGADIARDSSAYIGLVAPIGGSSLGGGLAVRISASAGEYDYSSGAAQIEARYIQGEAALIHQRSGDWGYFNLGLGARLTDTDLDPDDPGNERNGSQWDGVVSADGLSRAGPWEVGGFASYGVDMEAWYVRAEASRAVGSGPWRLGGELIAEGDPTYDRQSAGALVAYQTRDGSRLRVGAGYRQDDTRDGAYVSIGIVRTF